jgi:hypothetical protein
MAKAYALRDAREGARGELVKQKYDLQWREACDDARTLDSKAMTLYMNTERLRQIEEKKLRHLKLSDQEGAFLSEWTKQVLNTLIYSYIHKSIHSYIHTLIYSYPPTDGRRGGAGPGEAGV